MNNSNAIQIVCNDMLLFPCSYLTPKYLSVSLSQPVAHLLPRHLLPGRLGQSSKLGQVVLAHSSQLLLAPLHMRLEVGFQNIFMKNSLILITWPTPVAPRRAQHHHRPHWGRGSLAPPTPSSTVAQGCPRWTLSETG